MPSKKSGFASLPPEKLKKVSALGGKATWEKIRKQQNDQAKDKPDNPPVQATR